VSERTQAEEGRSESRPLLELLEASRRREKAQTLLYRALAAEAEDAGHAEASERLNGLHADEQHHLSRLTARVLELGGRPAALRDVPAPEASLDGWEAVARERERGEIAWYESLMAGDRLDPVTRAIIDEIVASERQHERILGGKWMSA